MPRPPSTEPREARIRRLLLRHLEAAASAEFQGFTRAWMVSLVSSSVFRTSEIGRVMDQLVDEGAIERRELDLPRRIGGCTVRTHRYVLYRVKPSHHPADVG